MATELLPGFLAGLVVAAVFSAICSTADSQLLEASAALTDDLVGPDTIRPASASTTTEKAPPRAGRTQMAVVGIGLLSAALAMTESKVVFWFVLYAWAALGAGFGSVLLVSTLWQRCSSVGALAGLVTGPLVVVLWKSVFDLSSVMYELLPAFGLSVLLTILGSLFFPDRGALS